MNEDQGGPNQSSGESSFEERLRAARERQRLDRPPPGPAGQSTDGFSLSPLGIGLRVGVELVAALVVAVAIGWALDRWLGTKPVFLAVFVLLGGAAGVLNVWRMFAPKPARPGGN